MKLNTLVLISLMILIFSSCKQGKDDQNKDDIQQDTIAVQDTTPAVIAEDTVQQNEIYVLISTDMGDMKAKLYNKTPKHRDNFVKLVKQGWFNGSPFHRVINSFMIQGGGHKDGREDPGYTIPAEFFSDLYHKKGALAAARTGDEINPQKASSGSQFYIVQGKPILDRTLDVMEADKGIKYTGVQRDMYKKTGGTPFLDMAYTVFGEVVEGLDVIDKIAAVKTGKDDKPLKDVRMTIKIIEQ